LGGQKQKQKQKQKKGKSSLGKCGNAPPDKMKIRTQHQIR
jgi:hypothetical protein